MNDWTVSRNVGVDACKCHAPGQLVQVSGWSGGMRVRILCDVFRQLYWVGFGERPVADPRVDRGLTRDEAIEMLRDRFHLHLSGPTLDALARGGV